MTGFLSLLLPIAVVGMTSCSPSKSPHFPEKKTFGSDVDPDAPAEEPLELANGEPGGENSQDNIPDPTPTDPSAPSPSISDPEPEPNTEPEEEYSYDQTLFHFQFQGGFDQSSLQRIVDKHSTGPVREGKLVSNNIFIDPLVDSFFSNAINVQGPETLDIIIKENGQGQFKVPMIARTTKGDRLQVTNGSTETQSGSQTLYWTTDPEDLARSACPKPFICVERMTWQPVKGQDWSFCMRDPETRLPMPVPFAPNPNFTKEAFDAAVPKKLESGVVLVSKHRGIHACDEPELVTSTVDLIKWAVTPMPTTVASQRGFYRFATFKPLLPDVAMNIEVQRYSSQLGRTYLPRKAPYVDQSTKLNSRVIYYLNTTKRVFTKAIRAAQEPVNTLPGSLVTNGIQVDYHFELCRILNNSSETFNHCTGR